MSLDNFLNQTCTIVRPNKTGVDRYNANNYGNTTVASDVRCRLTEKSVKVMDQKTSEYSWVKVKMILLPAGTAVKTLDEVTVAGVKYEVKDPSVRQRGNSQHHVACIVEALNG